MGLFTKDTNKSDTKADKSVLNTSGISDTAKDVKELYAFATSFLEDGKNFLGATTSDVAKQINSTISGLFDNTASKSGSNITIPIPDPIKGNFATSKPKSNVFVTSTATNRSLNQNTNISTKDITNSDIVSKRYDTSGRSLYEDIFGNTKSNAISSLLTSTNLNSGTSNFTKSISNVTRQVSKEYNNLTGSLSNTLFGAKDNLLGSLDTTISPSITRVNGVISDTLSSQPVETINSILGLAKNIGCTIDDIKTESGAASQSAYNALLSISANLNLTDIFDRMLSCNNYSSGNKSLLKSIFTDNLSKNIGISGIASEKLDPMDIWMDDKQLKGLVKNTSELDEATTNKILEKAKIDRTEPFKTYNDTSSRDTLDMNTVAETNSTVLNSMLASESASSFKVLQDMN